MANITNEPEKIRIISDQTAIKAYVHPTRQLLLKYLANAQMTISAVANELKVHPANITHHFRILEKAGLIRLVEKRDTGRNLEKYYRACALNYVVSTERIDIKDKRILGLSMLRSDLDSAIRRTSAEPGQEVLALLETVRLSPEDFPWIRKKFESMARELKKRNGGKGECYTANISIYRSDADNGGYSDEVTIE